MSDLIGLNDLKRSPVAPKPRTLEVKTPKAPQRSKKTLIWIIAGSVAAIAAVGGLAAMLMSPSGGGDDASTVAAMLQVDVPENQRNDTTVTVNGQRKDLPKTGPVQFTVTPGKCQVAVKSKDRTYETTAEIGSGKMFKYFAL